MSEIPHVFVGTFVHSSQLNQLNIQHGFMTVERGMITLMGSKEIFKKLKHLGYFNNFEVTHLENDEFLMPGLVDCHTHAPQFPNLGLGLDKPLLEWLDKYTFPLEKKFKDLSVGVNVYDQVVKKLILNGTTTACYFGTLHIGSTTELARVVEFNHQRGLVGKVSMNIKNDDDYYHDTPIELLEVDMFVNHVVERQCDLLEAVVTPRFAVSCDDKLMKGLVEIAKKYNCKIQSHISENKEEIRQVLNMNPDCRSYADVYDKSGILNNMCIMAHAVHLDDEEMKLLAARGVSVAHCPASNTRLKSGLCPVRKLLEHGIHVGLGTDVSGGDSATILDAMRRAMDVSTHLELMDKSKQALSWKEVFYLATLGGAKALRLDNKIGKFEIGKEFDALRIKVFAEDSPISRFVNLGEDMREEGKSSLVQRFVYLGDDRNIVEVFVKGKKIKSII